MVDEDPPITIFPSDSTVKGSGHLDSTSDTYDTFRPGGTYDKYAIHA